MHKIKHNDYVKFGGDKAKKQDQVPDKFKRRAIADMIVKKALVVWKNSSSESEESRHYEDVSTLAIKDEEDVFA